jgi:hypothetical protein
MRRKTRTATALAVAGFGLVGSALQVTAATGPSVDRAADDGADPARAGVCTGVRDCQVIGRFDVTGNGRSDSVGLVNHDRDGYVGKGRVTVRVKTDRGRLVKQRVGVQNWRGAVWFGAAAVNGRAGKELVVGAERHKYTQDGPIGDRVTFSKTFHVITFSPGSDLSHARGPGGSKLWSLTGPDGVRSGSGSGQFYQEWGWWRKKVNGEVRLQKRRLVTGGAAGIQSRRTVWAWRHGQWRQLSSRPMSDPLDKKYGGWHVKGLPVW